MRVSIAKLLDYQPSEKAYIFYSLTYPNRPNFTLSIAAIQK